jgi:hypothetical protein
MTIWWMKWFTAARAVALGYNVMAVDADVIALDDFYFRVKQVLRPSGGAGFRAGRSARAKP